MSDDIEKEWDLIILGTGLTEELLSAAVSMHKHENLKILNLERNKLYGSNRITFNINEFLEFSKENNFDIKINKITEVLGEKYRAGEIYIDMLPQLIFSNDDIITCLINTKCHSTLAVRPVDGLYYPDDKGEFDEVPASKSSIFKNSSLSLKQKRTTMKYVNTLVESKRYGNVTKDEQLIKTVEEYKDKPYTEFLLKLGFDNFLVDAFQYFVAGAFRPILTEEAINRTKIFANSIGVYGDSPFITVDYGSGDLPQTFARCASIYSATFMLNQKVKEIKKLDTNEFSVQLSDDSILKTKNVVCSYDQFDSPNKRLLAHRAVIITQYPLLEGHISTLMIPPNRCDNTDPVWIFQYDYYSQCVQNGKYILHFVSMGDLSTTVDRIKLKNSEFNDSIFFEARFDLYEPLIEEVEGVYYVRSPTAEESLIGTNYFTDSARKLLEKMYPDTPFFPEQTEVLLDV